MYLHYIILAALNLCFAAACLGEDAYERRRNRRKRPMPKPSEAPSRTDGYNPIFSCIDHGDSVTMIYNGKEDAANGTLHE